MQNALMSVFKYTMNVFSEKERKNKNVAYSATKLRHDDFSECRLHEFHFHTRDDRDVGSHDIKHLSKKSL